MSNICWWQIRFISFTFHVSGVSLMFLASSVRMTKKIWRLSNSLIAVVPVVKSCKQLQHQDETSIGALTNVHVVQNGVCLWSLRWAGGVAVGPLGASRTGRQCSSRGFSHFILPGHQVWRRYECTKGPLPGVRRPDKVIARHESKTLHRWLGLACNLNDSLLQHERMPLLVSDIA